MSYRNPIVGRREPFRLHNEAVHALLRRRNMVTNPHGCPVSSGRAALAQDHSEDEATSKERIP